MQPVRGVDRQPPLGGAEDRDPPVALTRVGDEAPDELRPAIRRSDGIARDDRDAADDAVGEKRGLVVGEEVRLVGAEHERRERVEAPRLHECSGQLALVLGLHAPGAATARASR